MLWLIFSFLFVYGFMFCLYYSLQHLGEIKHNAKLSIKPKITKVAPLEDVGKLYSNYINIPIIDDALTNKNHQKLENSKIKNTVICKACSNTLPPDSKFCIYCGSKISQN